MDSNGKSALRAQIGGRSRRGLVFLLATGALALGACGGGSSPAGPSSTSTTSQRQQIGQGNFTLADSATAVRLTGGVDFAAVAITTNVAGTLETVADWTYASNDLDVYLFRGNCNTSQIAAGACGNPFAQSESATAKPERLSAPGMAAGAYTLVIASNFGNTAESGNFQVFLTP